MRTITKEYKVYKYNELSESAKEKVKQWYLDGQEAEFFTQMCLEDLNNLFGDNNLNVQYSLGYCQGDGFNIYGEIEAENILKCLENHNGGTQLEKFENVLTDEEKETIRYYAIECGIISLPHNRRYCYSLSNYIDIADNWSYYAENYSDIENVDYELLRNFEYMVKEIFLTLCGTYEENGYNYFYEISDEDLAEICEANDYEFLSNGKLFY